MPTHATFFLIFPHFSFLGAHFHFQLVDWCLQSDGCVMPESTYFRALVAVARHNLEQNQITNATVLHMAAGDFALSQTGLAADDAAAGGDDATVVPAVPAVLGYDAVLLDPPRIGLDAETMALACRFDNILMISCNQAGLLESLQTRLLRTHRVYNDVETFFYIFTRINMNMTQVSSLASPDAVTVVPVSRGLHHAACCGR